MPSRAQSSALGKGLVAAIERNKERVTSIIEIEHAPSIPQQSLLKGVTYGLAASGAVNMAHTSVRFGDTDLLDALHRSEVQLLRTEAALAEKSRQLEVLLAQRGDGDTREWITMEELAARKNVCHTTIWRAYKAGRLVTKPNGGGRKKIHRLCDPASYVPATGRSSKKT